MFLGSDWQSTVRPLLITHHGLVPNVFEQWQVVPNEVPDAGEIPPHHQCLAVEVRELLPCPLHVRHQHKASVRVVVAAHYAVCLAAALKDVVDPLTKKKMKLLFL